VTEEGLDPNQAVFSAEIIEVCKNHTVSVSQALICGLNDETFRLGSPNWEGS